MNALPFDADLNRGLDASEKEVLRVWDENAGIWQYVTPPWRPSAGVLDLYTTFSQEKLHGDILVLGATPELRDLASQYNKTVTVVDISRKMLEQTSKFLTKSDPRKEKWIVGDWCNTALPPVSFDLILGDMIWWLLPSLKQSALSAQITSSLKDGGHFISRFRIFQPKRMQEDPRNIITDYLQLIEDDPLHKVEFSQAMLLHISDIVSNVVLQRMDRNRVSSLLMQITNDVPLRHKALLEEITHSWKGKLNLTQNTRKEIVECLGNGFNLLQEKSATDYPEGELYPIMKWVKGRI